MGFHRVALPAPGDMTELQRFISDLEVRAMIPVDLREPQRGIFGVTPRQVEDQGLSIFGSRATAVVTNVRGPGLPLYIAGRKIENIMGWVPQAGHLGLVPDPERITAGVRTRFDELLALATAANQA